MKYIFPILVIGFLFANCGKDDVSATEQEIIERYIASNSLTTQMTASGLLYVIEEEGTGNTPTSDQAVILKIKEYLLNGDLIFDSGDSPFVATLSSLPIPGLRESTGLLKKGGKGSFILPSNLAFGANGSGNIPPNTPLLFELELLDIQEDILTYETLLFEEYLAANNLTAQTTASGLQYIIEETGSGGSPSSSSQVQVNYKGYFLDGEVFDQSNGTPINIGLGNVIQGWQEGIPLLQKGGKGVLLIPSHLAYGISGSGSIPGNTPILFDVELIDFN